VVVPPRRSNIALSLNIQNFKIILFPNVLVIGTCGTYFVHQNVFFKNRAIQMVLGKPLGSPTDVHVDECALHQPRFVVIHGKPSFVFLINLSLSK
jgi:hypothetical protein